MSLITWATSSLISGISQQPDTLRFASQAELQENGFSSLVDGLIKRHPTDYVAKLLTVADLGAKSTRFHMINRDVDERYLAFFMGAADDTSPEVKVWDLKAKVFRNIYGATGTDAPSFDYLNSTDPDKIRAMTVGDNTFVVNPTKKVEKDAAVLPATSGDAYIFVKAGNYEQEYTVKAGLWTNVAGVSESVDVSVNTWDGNDTANVINKTKVQFLADPNLDSYPQDYKVSYLGDVWTYTQVDNSPVGSEIAANLTLFYNNKSGLTAVSGPSWEHRSMIDGTFEGLDIRGTVINVPTLSGVGTAMVMTEIQSETAAQQNSIQTDDIAASLATKLNAATSNAAFTAEGSVIRCVPTYGEDGTTSAKVFRTLQLKDSNANTLMNLANKKVDKVTNLPLVCTDGFSIEVQGNPESDEDNFYLEFEAKDGAGVFGSGIWKEAAKGGEQYKFNDLTMPHRLERFFDPAIDSGAAFFRWTPIPWVDRLVGDVTDTNPWPSFVSTDTADRYITDVLFFRNRMGFLSRDNIILSEVSNFENFWRTTTTALLDGDPIDVGVGHSKVSLLNSGVAWNEKLVLFSDQTQFILEGEPYLTPSTVQVSAVTEYENDPSIRPITSGPGVVFAYAHGDYSGLRELMQTGDSQYIADDLTVAVPKYIKGNIKAFASSTLENMLAVLSDGDTSSLYIYKYYYGKGERLQSSWSKYTFGADADIQNIGFITNTLYITVKKDGEIFVEKMEISDGALDAFSDHITTMDRRVTDVECATTYDSATDTTSIVLPYLLSASSTYAVVSRATSATNAGHIYTLSAAPSGSTVTVFGDASAAPFWVGENYAFKYQFSAPRLRETTGAGGGRTAVSSGRQQVNYGTIVYSDSSHFTVGVTPEGRDEQINTFSSSVVDSSLSVLGATYLDSGSFRFPIHSKNDQVAITLENNSPIPSNIISIEWEVDFTTRSTRYRG